MAKNFIDFIVDAGRDGALLAEYVGINPTKAALTAFFEGKGYTIADTDLGKLAEAKKRSKDRVSWSQQAFTPPGGGY